MQLSHKKNLISTVIVSMVAVLLFASALFYFTGGGHGSMLYAKTLLGPFGLTDHNACILGLLFWPSVAWAAGAGRKYRPAALVLFVGHYLGVAVLLATTQELSYALKVLYVAWDYVVPWILILIGLHVFLLRKTFRLKH